MNSRSSSRLMSATVAFVVSSLMIAGLEPAAFAGEPDEVRKSEERLTENAENVPPAALPSRPAIMTGNVAPNDAVGKAIAQSQTPRTTSPTPRPAYVPPARQNTGKSKKWIWILAGAAAAGVTVAILARGGDDPPEPATITLGTPTVGQPQ